MIVLALATSHKIAIAAMGAVFIAFALVSSFVLPRRSPNFPNRNVGLFVLASVVLFLAMLTAILVFGVEEEEPSAEASAAETSTEGGEEPGATRRTDRDATHGDATDRDATHGDDPRRRRGGDRRRGGGRDGLRECGLHGLPHARGGRLVRQRRPEPRSGEAGPRPDPRARVNGKGAMPPFKGQLSEQQIADVVEFVYSSTHG